jgi:hypothetical protein
MKVNRTIVASLLFFGMISTAYSADDKDSLGLPGDHLDLYGVLELFKKSETPEAFEKALNSEKNEVNNLDLNGDKEIDYIKVIDKVDNGAHAFILQVPVNETEMQDVAVIEIEKKGDAEADLQIVGDEELYGKDYIVEPADGKSSGVDFMLSPVFVNVWGWPVVTFVYSPRYVVWVSPWHWRYYPVWWTPWTPVYWHVHHKRVIRYHVHCHRTYTHRVMKAHSVYAPHRTVSKTVVAKRGPAGKKQNVSQPRGGKKQNNNVQQKPNRNNNQQKAGKPAGRTQKSGGAPKGQRSGGGGKGQKGGGKGGR